MGDQLTALTELRATGTHNTLAHWTDNHTVALPDGRLFTVSTGKDYFVTDVGDAEWAILAADGTPTALYGELSASGSVPDDNSSDLQQIVSNPVVLANGNVAVLFIDEAETSTESYYYKLFMATIDTTTGELVGTPVDVTNGHNFRRYPDVDLDLMDDGGFRITWTHPSFNTSVYTALLDAQGLQVGDEYRLSYFGDNVEAETLSNGNTVFVWNDAPDNENLYRFFRPGEIPWQTVGSLTTLDPGEDTVLGDPDVVTFDNTWWVAAWDEETTVDGVTTWDVAYKVFAADGSSFTGKDRVAETEGGNEKFLDIVATNHLDGGGFVIAYAEEDGSYPPSPRVWLQAYDTNGAELGEPAEVVIPFENPVYNEDELNVTGFLRYDVNLALTPAGHIAVTVALGNETVAGIDPIYPVHTQLFTFGEGVRKINWTGNHNRNVKEGKSNDDTFHARGGNDKVYGREGNDVIYGEDGNDRLFGDEGEDEIFGGAGRDTLFGGDDDDFLNGGGGNDLLKGEAGEDTLYGAGGRDRLEGGDGNDILDGGSGGDHLYGQDGDDIMDGGGGSDVFLGGEGNDTLDGQEGDDYVYGSAGNDTLRGGNGTDRLKGGNGDDWLSGDGGKDYLVGGNGADVFAFLAVTDSENTRGNRDWIHDFDTGIDQIDLSVIDAIEGGSDDAFTFISGTAFSGTAGELRFVEKRNKDLLLGDTDGDGRADFVIEFATGTGVQLVEEDIIL